MAEKLSHLNSSLLIRNNFIRIVLNVGVGRLSSQPSFEEKILPQVVRDVSLITGQKPKVCRARKSIAGFKIRQGQIVGLQVNLRGQRMVDFFERLIKIVLPRVRDFSGINLKSVDEGGVLNLGFKEHFVFPEVDSEHSLTAFPLGVNVVPKSSKRDLALKIYTDLGVPFKKVTSSKSRK